MQIKKERKKKKPREGKIVDQGYLVIYWPSLGQDPDRAHPNTQMQF